MTTLGTPENPLTTFSADQAEEHWANGNGGTVYVDMASHMSSGGGRWFSMRDFATPIAQAISELPEGTVVRFETNRAIRDETGAENATASHPLYWVEGPVSDNAYVWGKTSAGFRRKFPNLQDAAREGNWEIAAEESERSNVGDDRNDYVHNLFLDAARTP